MHGNGKVRAPIMKKTTTRIKRLRRTSSPPPPPPPPATCTVCGDVFRKERLWEEETCIITETVPLLSVIATLVCGHLYHEECLERFNTPSEFKSDPSCPFCKFPQKEKQSNNLPEEVSAGGKSTEGESLGKRKERNKSSVQIAAGEKSIIRAKKFPIEAVERNKTNVEIVEKKTIVEVVQKKPMSKHSGVEVVQKKPVSKHSSVELVQKKPMSKFSSIEALQKKTNLEAFQKKTNLEAVKKKTNLEAVKKKTNLEAVKKKTNLEAVKKNNGVHIVLKEELKNCTSREAGSNLYSASTSAVVAESSKRITTRSVSKEEC